MSHKFNWTIRFQSLYLLLQTNPDEIDWENYWNPKIYVENNLGEPKETIWQTLMFNAKGEAIVYERWVGLLYFLHTRWQWALNNQITENVYVNLISSKEQACLTLNSVMEVIMAHLRDWPEQSLEWMYLFGRN